MAVTQVLPALNVPAIACPYNKTNQMTKHRRRNVALGIALLLLIPVLFLLEPWRLFPLWKGIPVADRASGHARPADTHQAEERWLREHAPTLLAPAQLQALYESLIQGYWVPQTGLFLSFPRTGDLRLIQQASTYDQGVIGILLLRLGELDKVKRLLSFYEEAWASAAERSGPREGIYGLSNFYNAYFRVEGIEKTMHVGPNAWIGLLASRYYRRTGDKNARDLALSIAHWMIDKVPHTDGAIAMGQIPWNSAPWDKIFSTENNLSAYAFMGDLLKTHGLGWRERSAIEREHERIGHWLVKKAYQPETRTVLRGFHPHGLDRAGAIDSYTWFLSSLRPAHLEARAISLSMH